jgi:hypothetical protein
MQHAPSFDRDALDEGAVEALQVADPEPVLARLDFRVHTRDGAIG